MVIKSINATAAKPGTTILWENVACVVKSNDISKTGKHGHAKCRMEVVGIFDSKKRIGVVPGHDKLEVPLVEKKKAQVLSFDGSDKVSVMDLESFETFDLSFSEDLKDQLAPEKQVEYWDIEGEKKVMKVL
jgi:translation initiation factor 5A